MMQEPMAPAPQQNNAVQAALVPPIERAPPDQQYRPQMPEGGSMYGMTPPDGGPALGTAVTDAAVVVALSGAYGGGGNGDGDGSHWRWFSGSRWTVSVLHGGSSLAVGALDCLDVWPVSSGAVSVVAEAGSFGARLEYRAW